jgi:CRISPR-associated endonuclease/helicase Cas3
MYLAHSANAEGKCHDLHTHLIETASLARKFAEKFGVGDWGYITGLWHDLGKFSEGGGDI